MTEKILDNFYRIEVPLVGNPLRSLNAYFIKGQDKSLLIDTGFNQEACYSALTEGLRELGAKMDETDIFLTHMHGDHSGLAAAILRPGRKIIISREDGDHLVYGTNSEYWEDTLRRMIKNGFPKQELMSMQSGRTARSYSPARVTDFTAVSEGDVLSYGGYELECIASPGHTKGHMCLYEREHKLMVLGDHVLFDISPNIVYWTDFENSLETYMASLEKFRAYDIDIPLPAHRGIEGSTKSRIEALIAHHERRLNAFCDIVSANGAITAYDAASLASWRIRANSWQDFPVMQKWFAVGETLAHLYYLEIHGKIKRIDDGKSYLYTKV